MSTKKVEFLSTGNIRSIYIFGIKYIYMKLNNLLDIYEDENFQKVKSEIV